jgi:hypothetical protein
LVVVDADAVAFVRDALNGRGYRVSSSVLET